MTITFTTYRRLKLGESRIDGDECSFKDREQWCPVVCFGPITQHHLAMFKYRRLIPEPNYNEPTTNS